MKIKKKKRGGFFGWLAGRSMESKLMFVFTVSIVAASALTYGILSDVVLKNYQNQLLFSASQSYEQASQFLENSLASLSSSADAMYYNQEMQKYLTLISEKSREEDIAFQYQQMYGMQNILYSYSSCQQNDLRISLYVPENLIFSQQNDFFFSLDSLKNNPKILHCLNLNCWIEPENIPFCADVVNKERISLVRKIYNSANAKETIALLRVSVPVSVFQNIVKNSNITRQGTVMIFDDQKKTLISSNQSLISEKAFSAQADKLSLSDSPHSWSELSLEGKKYYVKLSPLGETGWTFAAIIPRDEILSITHQIGFILMLVLSGLILAVCFFSYYFSRRFTLRIRRLSQQMEVVQAGNLEGKIENHDVDEIGKLIDNFNIMEEKLSNYQREIFEKGKAIKSLELNALQSQINPHFLYNTLDLINWESLEYDVPQIGELSRSLARFYKLSLNHGRDIISLGEELEHASIYTNIQNCRFDSRIHLQIDVPRYVLRAKIPKIILQPLVENSIQHGLLENMDDYVLDIYITAKISRNPETELAEIYLTVQDNGAGMSAGQLNGILFSAPDSSHGYGVQNVHSRLQLYFGDGYGLSYQSVLGEGTVATVYFPFQPMEGAES